MVDELLFFLLPFAAASGWYAANRSNKKNPHDNAHKHSHKIHKDCFIGLNFILNEQPDKAVDLFIKMLEVDSDTVETHLALGSLFRRRGEVDRAIRIHQNLIARPNLDAEQRKQALLALGQDYLKAGMLDRAERIFLETIEAGEETNLSLHYLLDIYQQEKAWEQAITTAQKIEDNSGCDMKTNIAHYYCELAVLAESKSNLDRAQKYLKMAFAIDNKCVRASLLRAKLDIATHDYQSAINIYQQIKYQNPDFLSEAIPPLVKCYKALGKPAELIDYLQECLEDYPRVTIVLVLVEILATFKSVNAAIALMTNFLKQHPSIRGLEKLIDLQVQGNEENANLAILKDITMCMLKNKPIYLCHQCGFKAKTLLWLCPSCKNWNSVKPIHGLEGD